MSNQSRLWEVRRVLGEWRGGIESLLFLKNSVALDKACLLWYNISAIRDCDLVRRLARRSNKGREGVGIQTSKSGKSIRYRISTRRRESVGFVLDLDLTETQNCARIWHVLGGTLTTEEW
jgi:hypothetical protein